MKTSSLLIAALTLTFASAAFAAEPSTSGGGTIPVDNSRGKIIDQREVNQQKRIGEGIENGSLTAKEAVHLEKQELRVDKMEKRAEKDGSISGQEFKKIEVAQNHMSREIYRKKHNARKR